MRSIFDILHKNFQEDQLNSRFPGVEDTLIQSTVTWNNDSATIKMFRVIICRQQRWQTYIDTRRNSKISLITKLFTSNSLTQENNQRIKRLKSEQRGYWLSKKWRKMRNFISLNTSYSLIHLHENNQRITWLKSQEREGIGFRKKIEGKWETYWNTYYTKYPQLHVIH